MYSLGIDIGYSSIKYVLIDNKCKVVDSKYVLHKGRVKEQLLEGLNHLITKYGKENISYGAATGQGSKFLCQREGLSWVNEVTSVIEGSLLSYPEARSIVEIGGQSSKYITNIDNQDLSSLKISINSNCAAGTGAFIEEQVSRLGINLDTYSDYTSMAKSIPRIAGRCSVFAKTDIIHHQQEGTDVKDILLGLAYALVKNYRANVVKKNPIMTPILLTGGVAYNMGIVGALRDVLKLKEDEVIVADDCGNVAAKGAAVFSYRESKVIDLELILKKLESNITIDEIDDKKLSFQNLQGYGVNDSLNKHTCKNIEKEDQIRGYIGLDIGSTSTNVVLIDEDNNVLAFKYLRTLGDPLTAAKKGLLGIREEIKKDINILGVGATGSGRHMVGKYVGADVILDEITAQAKAATFLDEEVDTIIEIGGQDSKFIKLKNGFVTDFEMNKICAAGTGSFIEEQAKKLNIPINDFGKLALDSKNPVDLGDRCTVFIETNIAASISKGSEIEDIAAGLSYSIVKNYLNKVVGEKEIGKKIFFQGGVAYNQAVVNAFRAILGEKMMVPKFFSVTGAFGVAILTKEQMHRKNSTFRGFSFENISDIEEVEKANPKPQGKNIKIFDEIEKLYLKGYKGEKEINKKTIGIPRVLFLHKLFPLFNTFFDELGFNVILSDITNEETVELSQEYAMEETCYPVKLINGHVAQLIQKGVDYVFLPSLYTMAHPISTTRQNYGCVYMQCFPKLINKTMDLESKGIELLSPVLSFKFGKKYMMKTLMELGGRLNKNPIQTAMALAKGMKNLKEFERKVELLGEETVKSLGENEKAFVIVTRGYGITDPILNMGIPEQLEKLGYKVLTLSNLPAHDHNTAVEHPNMYWPFGQHILSGAQIIKQHPNLYAIYITNHGCGPDTVLAHYFKEEMRGKPYLNIEVDEHFSKVGVLTRIEAFINSLKSEEVKNRESANLKYYSDKVNHTPVNIKTNIKDLSSETILYLPNLYPYSDLFATYLRVKGYHGEVLHQTCEETLDLGRKFTLSKEYLSFTGLVGDVLNKSSELRGTDKKYGFFVPTSEGSEAGGQYHRLLRDKLDGENLDYVEIFAPFIEDVIKDDEGICEEISLILLSGDLINLAPRNNRGTYLEKIQQMIKDDFSFKGLMAITKDIYNELHELRNEKRIFTIGEPNILYNDFLNNNTLMGMEEEGVQIIFAPMSEYMWFIWKDFLDQKVNAKDFKAHENHQKLTMYIKELSKILLEFSPFDLNLEELVKKANGELGLYAGANGRYRIAKLYRDMSYVKGIVTISSMYENTNTILNILAQGSILTKPVLNLGFDGNSNEIDRSKIDSFLYYAFKEESKKK